MTTYTTNLNLKKPALADDALIGDINNNMDLLDTDAGKLRADIGIVENGNTATHNITEGQYVIWKGDLYVASSAIASGATLSSSNLTAKPNGIGGELNTLSDHIGKYETINITADTTKIETTNDMWGKRIDRVVTMSIGFNSKVTNNGWVEGIATFATDSNPPNTIYFPMIDETSDTIVEGYIGGGLFGIRKPTANHYYKAVITYVCKTLK